MSPYVFILLIILYLISLVTLSYIVIRLLQANNEYNKRALYMVVSTHNKEMEAMYDELMDAIDNIDANFDAEARGDVPSGEPTQDDLLEDFTPHDFHLDFGVDEEV